MFRRVLAFVPLLVLASPAWAFWRPHFVPDLVKVEVGKTETVMVHADWPSGISLYSYHWKFVSEDPSIAVVEGEREFLWPEKISRGGEMRITGVRPGQILGYVDGIPPEQSAMYIWVVCGAEDPIQAAAPEQIAATREPIALRALTPIANRTTFTWYLGRTGDTSRPISASGPEIAFVTNDIGTHYAWVLATTPCSSSSAEFRIDAHAPRRRAVR